MLNTDRMSNTQLLDLSPNRALKGRNELFWLAKAFGMAEQNCLTQPGWPGRGLVRNLVGRGLTFPEAVRNGSTVFGPLTGKEYDARERTAETGWFFPWSDRCNPERSSYTNLVGGTGR